MVTSTMTTQQAYEAARAHFLRDRRYGWDPAQRECVYFGPGGVRCFVGSLMPKHLYDSEMEGKGVHNLVTDLQSGEYDNAEDLIQILNGDDDEGRRKLRFLQEGQRLHDECASRLRTSSDGEYVVSSDGMSIDPVPIDEFIAKLDDLARKFDLIVPST